MARGKENISQLARGEGFFATEKTFPYHPKGCVIGQLTPESCVAACCRMLLRDSIEDVVEIYLRTALHTDKRGANLSDVPDVLHLFGMKADYHYRTDLTIETLREATKKGAAIVAIKNENDDVHALIVDGIEDEYVLLRDPSPFGKGSAYKIALNNFVEVWLQKNRRQGRGVVVN